MMEISKTSKEPIEGHGTRIDARKPAMAMAIKQIPYLLASLIRNATPRRSMETPIRVKNSMEMKR